MYTEFQVSVVRVYGVYEGFNTMFWVVMALVDAML